MELLHASGQHQTCPYYLIASIKHVLIQRSPNHNKGTEHKIIGLQFLKLDYYPKHTRETCAMKQDRNMNIMFDLAIDLREGGMLRKKETRYNKQKNVAHIY
jgi:hypothetical protein